MATLMPRAAASRAEQAAAEEIEVLHPEREVPTSAGAVTVREYGHVEWLRLLPQAAPLVDSIARALEAEREPSYEDALAVMAQHIDALAPLVVQACEGLSAEAFERLDPAEGELLLMTWWGVNGRFFGSRALNRVAVARVEARRAGPSATAPSTPPSSPTDTPAASSAPTPSAS